MDVPCETRVLKVSAENDFGKEVAGGREENARYCKVSLLFLGGKRG